MNYTEEERAIVYLNFRTQADYREKVALLRKVLQEGTAESKRQREETDKLLDLLDRKNYFAVTLASPDYPEALKATDEPPLVLLGAGNRELLKKRKFCIVGSRMTPSWAEGVTKRIAEELSERFAIVTGLAEGGDRAAIRAL